jgi:hypothetical protein
MVSLLCGPLYILFLAPPLAVIDNMADSMATMQGNQGQLTVVVNRLQSEKIVVGDDRNLQTSHGSAISAACCGHKLLFPTYDGTKDPLPWLNRCEQFFRIQSILLQDR